MPYKNKQDPRYKMARMRWYHKNKLKHRAGMVAVIQEKRSYIDEIKAKPCMDCGKSFPPYVMDFDHRDRVEKKFNISIMILQGWERIQAEVEKCDVVCANCHRIRTYKNMAH